MKNEIHQKNNLIKTIFVDIDETICFYNGDRIYENAIPNYEHISKINQLYNCGNKIVYWTSRGSSELLNKTRLEYLRQLTINQLGNWGALYHELELGDKKPLYDLIIDDKAKRIEEL